MLMSVQQKAVDDQKLSQYTQGTVRKSKREKEREREEAKRREEEELARLDEADIFVTRYRSGAAYAKVRLFARTPFLPSSPTSCVGV